MSIDLYISSNDYFQQVIESVGEPLHVSTNGGGERREENIVGRNTTSEFVADQKGFSMITVFPEQLIVDMLNAEGVETYKKSLLR